MSRALRTSVSGYHRSSDWIGKQEFEHLPSFLVVHPCLLSDEICDYILSQIVIDYVATVLVYKPGTLQGTIRLKQ